MESFRDLPLRSETQRALQSMGFEAPTAIQREAVPLALKGGDVIAQAQTGTGKTAAFGIPLVEAVEGRGIQSLVLCPTRELASQVTEELNRIGEGSRFKAVSIFGGVGMGNQVSALKAKSTTCVVACPGRLLDHLRRDPDLLGGVHTVVLDEADRMLDMGFLPDVERILKRTPEKRQTLLFSATVPDGVRKLSRKHMKHPESVRTGEDSLTTSLAKQMRVDVPRDRKLATLLGILESAGNPRAVVFARTKRGARRLAQRIERAGITATSLQGNMTQNQRTRALDAFRDDRVRVLAATDVAARGLDVPDITHVINYDVPNEPEAYVHRIGRTGRNGREGEAYLFVEPGQESEVRAIEKLVEQRIEAVEVEPSTNVAPAPQNRSQNGNRGGGNGNGGNPRNRNRSGNRNRGGGGGRNRGRNGGGRGRGRGSGQRAPSRS